MDLEDLFANLMNCGTSDWACLKHCNTDIREIAKEITENEGRMPDLEDILDAIFHNGIRMMEVAVEDKIQEYEGLLDHIHNDPTSEEAKILEELTTLNPSKDMTYYVNYLDSNISILKNREIYDKYFADTISEIEDMTGYNIL